MKAVIMAGGKGTRLRPLSCDLPKPMVPILNRPMLEHILLLLKRHGITQVAITMCYLPEQIMDYFGDGSQWGMQIQYYIEEEPLGTAGSVQNAAEFLNETFLVISGDALTDFDLTKAVQYHQEKGALATQILTRVDYPLDYGVVITDAQGRIRQFLEKPAWSEVFSDTVNTGIYILEPEVFLHYEAGVEVDFSKDLFPYLLKKGEPLYGYISSGYWSDIGNLEVYRLSHFDALADRVRVAKDLHKLSSDVWVGSGTHIEPGATLKGPCYIGANCHIARGAEVGEYTIIGANCIIKGGASVKRSVLWDNVYLGQQAEVRGAVLADKVRLKEGSKVLEGAVVGKDCFIGRRVTIKPNVRIWPNKRLEDRVVLASSLIWGSKSPRHLFGEMGVMGIPNIDITPEDAVRLGAAFGCSLSSRGRIAVGADRKRAARIIKRALISGVLSSGVDVADLGIVTSPVLSYAITNLQFRGGVMVKMKDEDCLVIEFLDSEGLTLNKPAQRQLETLFFREDFYRPSPEFMGEISYLPSLEDSYLTSVLASLDPRELAGSHLRVLMGYSDSSAKSVLELLKARYPHLYEIRAVGGGQELALEVSKTSVDLGILLNSSGFGYELYDERGKILSEEQKWNLLVYSAFLQGRQRVAVPVNAPDSLDYIASNFRGEIIRTKSDPRSVLEQESPPRGLPVYDGIAVSGLLAKTLALTGLSVSQILEEFPVPVRKSTNIHCSWDVKGRVMRSLLEATQGEKVQLLDGVKVYHQKGWALVRPDPEEPLFQIISEADTPEEAEALAQMYTSKILKFSS